VLNNNLYVADTGNHRIVKFDTPDRWPAECAFSSQQLCAAGTAISPAGISFFGQTSGQAVRANQGGLPRANTLAQPVAIAFGGTDMWVVDSANHRILVFPQAGNTYTSANRVLGQLDFSYNAPNMVEGKELFLYDPFARVGFAGVAVDTTRNPPPLYIADSLNNRILAFRDARNVRPGQSTPDLVIGQPDLRTTTPNTFTGTADQPNDATLITPVGLVVDKVGDLWVADSGNSRVLRFSRPFEQTDTVRANLVLGQASMFSKVTDPLRNQMRTPWGLALTNDGHLMVSDASHHRVLVFRKPEGGDFRSGQNADLVIGQSDFTSSGSGNATNRFNSPRSLAVDTSDRLYVADAGNNRISIFSGVLSGELNPSARFTHAISNPQGIAVSARTGEVWVTRRRRW
jgi:sugar lactone lactonase YvrE